MKIKNITFLITIMIACGAVVSLGLNNFKNKSIENISESIIKTCKQSEYSPKCYEKKIVNIAEKIGLTESFRLVKLIQEKDKSLQYCHVIGHKISGNEVNNDPSKWIDIMKKCPTDTCSNGCMHGAIQEKFKKERLEEEEIERIKPDLLSLCDQQPGAPINKIECYHVLGHTIMYISGANLKKSIEFCESASEMDINVSNCIKGMFMTVFQFMEPEDMALVKNIMPEKGGVFDFCKSFEKERTVESCLEEAWPFYSPGENKAAIIGEYCSEAPTNYKERCYQTIIFHESQEIKNELYKQEKFCTDMSKYYLEATNKCFGYMAGGIISSDPRMYPNSIELCEIAKTRKLNQDCYAELLYYAQINIEHQSPIYKEFCESIKEKNTKYTCQN